MHNSFRCNPRILCPHQVNIKITRGAFTMPRLKLALHTEKKFSKVNRLFLFLILPFLCDIDNSRKEERTRAIKRVKMACLYPCSQFYMIGSGLLVLRGITTQSTKLIQILMTKSVFSRFANGPQLIHQCNPYKNFQTAKSRRRPQRVGSRLCRHMCVCAFIENLGIGTCSVLVCAFLTTRNTFTFNSLMNKLRPHVYLKFEARKCLLTTNRKKTPERNLQDN